MPDCRRGEVYWVDFSPARGVEQAGRRPALIVQNDRGNEHSAYTVVAAISAAELPCVYPFTVPVSPGEAGLPQACHINCAQLMTIDQNRLSARIGRLSPERLAEVDAALRYELGLWSAMRRSEVGRPGGAVHVGPQPGQHPGTRRAQFAAAPTPIAPTNSSRSASLPNARSG
ncbi:MAG: type II toxin-antitoxin system PemK/MazF family toxin [Armatimonadetes bacterium]|nr:type II toxin-antitoxin system PemK/MazF family toxin [Armatimonadota bacterium]